MEDKCDDKSIALRKIVSKNEKRKMESLLEKIVSVKYLKLNSLHSAMKSKFDQMILVLQKKNACNLVSNEEDQVTSLATARNGEEDSIKIFLQIGGNIKDAGITPLYIDVKQSRIDVIKQDLVDIARSKACGAMRCSSLHDAINNNLMSLLDLLLHHGIDQYCDGKWRHERNFNRYKSPIDRFAPLHLAIKNKCLRTDRLLSIVSLLIEYGSDIELKDKFGRTPLHLAVELRKLEVAKFLVITGANVNSVTENYSTPLLAALVNVDVASIRYLLGHGAKADVKNSKNESSLHVAIRAIDDNKIRYNVVQLLLACRVKINDGDFEKSTALHLALIKEDFSLFYLLISRGSLINLKNSYGYSPLYIAVARNLLEEAKILLKLGANVNDSDNCKVTILVEAVEQANEDMIRLLLKHNANVSDKNSVLVAADNGNVGIMKILVGEGADINVVDKMGLSVLVHAILFKHNAMVQYLLDNGADINLENKNFVPLTYSFLLYNFNGFVIHNPSDKESYKLTMNLVLSRIALRNAQNLYIHEENMKLIRMKDIIRNKYDDYCRELVRMKRTKVCEDTWVTYFHLLIKRHNALVQCLRYARVRDKLLSGDYKTLFAQYSPQIEINYHRGLERWLAISRFEESLNEIFKSLLPCNVTYKICQYFSNNDIEKYFQNYKVTL
jgi:ankyrin repeat protein